MKRSRRRRGVSRRKLLAGGLIVTGSGLLAFDTSAYSQVIAERGATLGMAADDSALLGLDTAIAAVGVDGGDLVGITNNTSEQLTVDVSLQNPQSGESVSPSQASLAQDGSQQFTSSISATRSTGTPVTIDVLATGSNSEISLSRTLTTPSLPYTIYDNSQNNNTEFEIQYEVDNVPNFGSITITVDNVSEGWVNTETFTRNTDEGVITYEKSGTGGDDHEITFEVTDADEGTVIFKTITKASTGSDSGEGDTGDSNDPTLDWFFVDDLSNSSDGGVYTVYYKVSNTDSFGEVSVKFDSQQNWMDQTITSTQNPIGKVEYSKGGANNANFNITVNAKKSSGIVVDSGTRSDVSDGTNPSNPDISLSDSPTLGTQSIRDLSGGGQADYEIDYSITNTERFHELTVSFENTDSAYATQTKTNTATSGTISYDPKWTEGDTYNIRTRVWESRSGVKLPVETTVVTDVADGTNP